MGLIKPASNSRHIRASQGVYGDLTKMLCVLRARDALAKCEDALPASIDEFYNARLCKITELLGALRKTNADEIPFALPLQLIRLATMAASTKNAADIAATPNAIAVSMVLDRLDDNLLALRAALKKRARPCRQGTSDRKL
jgi:hypothetical protein